MHGLAPTSPDAQWRDAFKRLHEALNRTMGEVVFEESIDRFVRAHPRFAHLRDDLAIDAHHSSDERPRKRYEH